MVKKTKKRAVSVADAKREFSDLLGRVAYGRETIIITRRGRPMAKLVPIAEEPSEERSFAERLTRLSEERGTSSPRTVVGRNTIPAPATKSSTRSWPWRKWE